MQVTRPDVPITITLALRDKVGGHISKNARRPWTQLVQVTRPDVPITTTLALHDKVDDYNSEIARRP